MFVAGGRGGGGAEDRYGDRPERGVGVPREEGGFATRWVSAVVRGRANLRIQTKHQSFNVTAVAMPKAACVVKTCGGCVRVAAVTASMVCRALWWM
jgi:hypothetical protein